MFIHLFLLFSLIGQGQVYAKHQQPPYDEDGQINDPARDHVLEVQEKQEKQNIANSATSSTTILGSNDIYDMLGLDKNGNSSIKKDIHDKNMGKMDKYEKKIMDKDGIKKDYLVSSVSCAGANLNACGTDIMKAADLFEYDAKLKTSIQLNKEYYKKIEAVRKNAVNYGRDKDLKLNSEGNKLAKELIIARTKMAEAESKLMDYDNRQKVSRFVKGEGNKVKKEDIEREFKNARTAFNSKIDELAKAKFEKDTAKDITLKADDVRCSVQDALLAAESDLKVSVDDVKADDIYNSMPAGLEACKDYAKKNDEDKKKCEALAGQYNAAASSGGSTWSPVTIYNNKDCSFMDNMGESTFKSIMAIAGAYKSIGLENCLMANGARGCSSQIASVKNFYGDPMNLTSQFYQDGQGNVGMNIAQVDTKINTNLGSQASSSLSIGGNIPSNLFSSYLPTGSSTTPSASGAGFGGGTGNRVNSGTGAAILNNIAGQVTATGTGAGNFNNQYASAANDISKFNSNLSSTLTSWTDPNIYIKSANSVQSVLDKAKGGGARYTDQTSYDNAIAIRQEITRLNKERSDIAELYMNEITKGSSDTYYLKYGSLSEKNQAAAHMAMMTGYPDYIKMQMASIDSRLQLYYTNTTAILNQANIAENSFDIFQMYASNGDAVYGKRALTLKPLKTPITTVTYVLKKGWQEEFKKYIVTMLQKAEESKKKMNQAKSKMQEMLSQKLPMIPLEKLPYTANVASEIRNMEGLEAVAKKNMKAIESAMEYHRSKKLETPSDVYAQYEKEADTLKRSMQNVVSSIDEAKPNLNRSYAILSKMDVEVPKAEALKRIAKQMVEQGL